MAGFSAIILLSIVLIAAVLVIGAIVIAVRNQNRSEDPSSQREGGKAMIKTVYTYLILFATLMMTIGGSVAAFMAVADLVSPPSYYMSFEDYKRGYNYPKEVPSTSDVQKSEDELKVEYQSMVNDEKNRAKERALNSLIKSFGWIVIPLPVFLYYQRRLRYEKQ